MNTLVYADVTEEQASSASSIASTVQQMSISFGVATAGLATVFFIPHRAHTNAQEMISGIHKAFLALGCLTILSAITFHRLKKGDGSTVSQHKVIRGEGGEWVKGWRFLGGGRVFFRSGRGRGQKTRHYGGGHE